MALCKRWQFISPPIEVGEFLLILVKVKTGCRNNWHIHHTKSGGGQILVCVAGRGYYQEKGKEAIEVPGEENSNEWCEAVSDEEYGKLK